MANTVTALSYANTFGHWMATTNLLVNENNTLGKSDYTKDTGTLFLNETTQNALQSNGSVIIQKELRVQGIGSSATIQNNLNVGGQGYFTNGTLSIATTGTANIGGVLYALAPNTALQVSNNALIQGNASIVYGTFTNTLQANARVNTAMASITGTTWTNKLQANTNVLTGVLNANTKIYTDVIISNTEITTAFFQANTLANTQTLTATQFVIANSVQANVSVNTSIASVTGITYTDFLQANTAANTRNLSVTNTAYIDTLQANTAANTRNLSVTDTALAKVVVANTALYTPLIQANTSINTAALFVQTLAMANTFTANVVINAPLISLSSGGRFDANTASGFFNNLQTQGQLSVGGNFVINGSTVYNSNTFTLNAGSALGQISYINVNRGSSGSNAAIRWNEPTTQFEIKNVSSNTYYRILTNEHFNDTLVSTSTTSVATANMANYLNNTITAANNFLQSAVVATGSYANAAFLQANGAFAAANNVAPQIQPAFSKANSAYALANTTSNTFVGTTGYINPTNGSVSFTSNNGLTIVATEANTLAISTSQDLRTSASPTFNSLSLTNPLGLSQGGTGATSASGALSALLPTGTTSGYVLTTGGPGSFYWAAGGGGGGGGGATPGTSINSTRSSYTANGAAGYTGNTYNTPAFTNTTQVRTYINGVRQFESDYSLNQLANTVTFSTTPVNGDKILIEVDGYFVNPYYANNITYGPPTGAIPTTANTIQLAIDSLESRKAALTGAVYTGVVNGISVDTNAANTAFATTAFVKNALNNANTYTMSITGNAGSVTSGVYTNVTYTDPAWLSLTKAKVGLGNVDNTADANKSVSYAATAGSAGSATSATTATTSTYSTYLSPISGTSSYKLAYTADGQRTNAGDWGRVVMRYDNNGQTYGVRVDRADYSDTSGTASAAPWSGITGKPTTVSGFGISDMGSQSVNYASSSTYSTYLSSSQQQNSIIGAYSSMPMTSGGGASGSFICRASGSGDYSLAGITFWNDSYAIRMGIRDDGYFGLGGWSRSAWSWYSDPSGNMVAAGNVTAYSDPRLKENFTRVQNALGIVAQLDGGKFTWKQGFKHTEMKAGKEDYGILADQVEAVLPELVTDSIDIEGEIYKTVAYEKLIPVLIEAIKELKAEIDVLKGQIK